MPEKPTEIRDAMLTHLRATLDPRVAAKIPTSALREVLSLLSEWAYGRFKASETDALQSEGPKTDPLRATVKPATEQSVFLDALDEIG